ncbi:hypothetical protein V500_02054 [Pseudogymnoascus sp. VKM F-4518 (FW-2643)]|nr:hypothetical protein V500_02054 [Pseudogymnoascus sp. VKM F-4518 (FW-2643)]
MAAIPRKPILISGAGISSLLLARSLLGNAIPFLIFERDSSPVFRAQGYRLRLSSEGLDAIESVLDPEGWKKFWDACGKTGGVGFSPINAVTGVIDESGGAPQVPAGGRRGEKEPEKKMAEALTSRDGKIVGISRGDMRRIFFEGCEEFVRWSHAVVGYELTGTGVRAIFADGTKSEEGEMLVAGDGIHSKVAKQVSGGLLKVFDTGAIVIHGQTPTAAFKGLGEGVWMLSDEGNERGKMYVFTNVRPVERDDPSVLFGWTMIAEPGIIDPPKNTDDIIGETAAEVAKRVTAHWHPGLRPIFDSMVAKDATFLKVTCSTPTGVPEWENKPRVTVIGDAAHSMTPAGGVGANTAMRDAALLGRLLREKGGWGEEVGRAYEGAMREFAGEAVRLSYELARGQIGIVIGEGTRTV